MPKSTLSKKFPKSALDMVNDMAERDLAPVPEGFTEVQTGFVLSKVGDVLTGTLVSSEEREWSDGKNEPKPTWFHKVRIPSGQVVEVLGAAQITAFFNGLPNGVQFWIQRISQVEGGKGRVNIYRFAIASRDAPKLEAHTDELPEVG